MGGGEAPCGVVYKTDAPAERGVSIAGIFPPDSHPPIVYPMAAMRTAHPAAAVFAAYLRGPVARARIARFALIAVRTYVEELDQRREIPRSSWCDEADKSLFCIRAIGPS